MKWPGLPDLRHRIYVPELMDDPDCDRTRLARTYRELALINRTLSRMRALLDRFVLGDVAERRQHATIVEVGCGGGDVLRWLAQQARQRRLDVTLIGVDTDARALATARTNLADFPEASVQELPLQQLQTLQPTADYVFCNHVLHHIPPEGIVTALTTLRQSARRRVLVNDLQRSAFSYAAYTALAGALFHRSFTYHDGRLSIRKGFTQTELHQLVHNSGYPEQTQVATAFPGRVYVVAPGAASSAAST